ncbi:unnamed protein product [Diatraea saccharalis]|uniref:Protein MIS12 homolog n=1 Tax=Diatraea saccharalis TaxID=40085 RepID=A0A9N9R390_9NEOP|nr:unnamed protein product [Diatraea saccharalis]
MIKTDPWCGGTGEEYETQHFGFGAQRLKIAIRQMVEQKIKTGVKDMESYLQDSLDLNDTDKCTLTHSCDKLIQLYCERAGPSLEIIDNEIEKVLKIPQNVLLSEDEVQLQDLSNTDYEKLKDEVFLLRKNVERGALMEALLTAEDEELSSLETVCETAKKDMELLDSLLRHTETSDSIKTIQHETQFLCASVPFMKNVVDNLIFDE